MIDFYLNKIEPVTMQVITRATSDHLVHNTNGNDAALKTDSEGHNGQEPSEPEEEEVASEDLTEEEIGEKVVKLNAAAQKGSYKFYFAFNPKNKELCINVLDRDTRRVIRSFGQSEIEDMLKRLTVKSGVLIDYKR